MIAPHRKGRKKSKTQDGRKLRPYRRRWKVERLVAWTQNILKNVLGVKCIGTKDIDEIKSEEISELEK